MRKNNVRIGDRFGQLVVSGIAFWDEGGRAWKVQTICDCGAVKCVALSALFRGSTHSCGCFRRRCLQVANTRHNSTGTRLYEVWKSMKYRCSAGSCKVKRSYWAKGIRVCLAWQQFEVFRDWALENGYRDDLEIDRIDGGKGYTPLNCRFVNLVVQSRNRGLRHDSSTGFIGVSFHRQQRVYYSYVWRSGKLHHLGSFADPFSAGWVRDTYLRFHGDKYARLNDL